MPTTQHWMNHIEAWQGSGLKKADYCRRHNIHVKTFAARFSDYQRLGEEENPVLIPVTVTQETVQSLPAKPSFGVDV